MKDETAKRNVHIHPFMGVQQEAEVIEDCTVGTLWSTTVGLDCMRYENQSFTRHQLPYAVRGGRYTKFDFEKGSIAIYAGPIRVNEELHNSKTISVLRHTFIINGRLVMVRSLADMTPAKQ
jgi:hypothetical protein